MKNNDCIFCKIIAGEMPCAKIYEDEHTFAFLTIQPDVEGHTLVIPKNCTRNFLTAGKQDTARVFETAQKIARHYVGTLGYGGVNICINNEAQAGQMVFHWHVHVIPRKEDDGCVFGKGALVTPEELNKIAERLRF